MYGRVASKLARKEIDLVNDNIKIALFTNSYVPNYHAHEFYSAIANELVGSGYVAGGKSLASKVLTQKTSDSRWVYSAADQTWTALTGNFRYAVIYDDSVTSKPLIACIDFGAQSASGQDVTVRFEYEYLNTETGTYDTERGLLVIAY